MFLVGHVAVLKRTLALPCKRHKSDDGPSRDDTQRVVCGAQDDNGGMAEIKQEEDDTSVPQLSKSDEEQ